MPDVVPDLFPLRRPDHVAIIGATDRSGSLGAAATRNLVDHSAFSGRISLVNPKRGEVLGQPTIPSASDLDTSPDVALVVLPREAAVEAVTELAEIGTAFAVVCSGGFGETDDKGRALQADMLDVVTSSRMRLVGPNSPGLADFHTGLALTIQPGYPDERRPGGLGLICQSGGLTRSILQWMHRGVGFSAFFSPGNQIDLALPDYIQHLAIDPATSTIAVVAESIGDVDAFEDAAHAALDAGKRLVLLKIGRSEAGRRAAASHTGSLVGSSDAAAAMARRTGIVLVEDLDDLVLTATWADRLANRRGRAAVYGLSGGAGVLLADALGHRGVELATLNAVTTTDLASVTAAEPTNPVDVGGPGLSDPAAFERGLRALCRDRSVSAVLVTFNAWYDGLTRRFVDATLTCAREEDTPLIPVWCGPRIKGDRDRLEEAGLLPADSCQTAARLLHNFQAAGRAASRGPEPHLAADLLRQGWLSQPARSVLTEDVVKPLLARAGVRVPVEQAVGDLAEALAVTQTVGFPCILKAYGPSILHRAGTGLVSDRIDGDPSLRQAWDDVQTAVARRGHDDAAGMLLTSFIEHGIEAHIGVATDPEWGPIISFGLGGTFVETLDDSTTVAPGTSRHELLPLVRGSGIASACRTLRLSDAVLEEFTDVLALVTAAVHRPPPIIELDLNPVILNRSGVWVVDALAVRTDDGPQATAGDSP